MRILWLKVGGLWPTHTGGRLRTLHLISELARTHRVTVMTTHGPADRPDALAFVENDLLAKTVVR